MGKKVVLAGLYSYSNLGDQVLIDTCTYLVDRAISKLNIEDASTETLDLMATSDKLIHSNSLSVFGKILSGAITVLCEKLEKRRSNFGRMLHTLYRAKNRIKYGRYFKKTIEDADCLIFVGGAYLKWATEEFQYSIRQVLNRADMYNVPVMMNAVGIEGYSEFDIRCQDTKKAINKLCVKTITTRDDVDFLNANFITRENIVTTAVPDPALWVKECYVVNKSACFDIGINISHKDVFKNNNLLYKNQYRDIVSSIVKAVQDAGLTFAFFSNGKIEDYDGGVVLIKELGLSPSMVLPNPQTPEEYVNQISMFRCIVPLRFHASIVAYALGVPICGYLWNDKATYFLHETEQDKYFQEVDRFDSKRFINTIQYLVKNERLTSIELQRDKTYKYIKLFLSDSLCVD